MKSAEQVERMNEFIWMLLWLTACLVWQRAVVHYQVVRIDGALKYRVPLLFALAAFAPLIYCAATRPLSFGDTDAYRRMYELVPVNLSGFLHQISENSKDVGFSWLEYFCKTVMGLDYRGFFWLIALFQGIVLAWVYRKYSSDCLISFLLFFASTDYVSWMDNGMRQFIAVCMLFACSKWLFNGDYRYLIVCLIASLIHQSALMMAVVFFAVRGEVWNKRMIVIFVLSTLVLFFANEFTDLLNDTLEGSQYANVVIDWKDFNDDGTNPLRVLIYSIPSLITLLSLKRIRWMANPYIKTCCNLSLLGTSLYIVSMFTSGIFIGRLPIFVTLYSYILLPWQIRNCFTKESIPLVKAVLAAVYLVIFLLQLNAWSML